jgi:uncharacterized glyoxalase superfamily protein PhnB
VKVRDAWPLVQAERRRPGRRTGVGLEVGELRAEHVRLAGLGVHFTMHPARQPWGGFMAMISDADRIFFYFDQVSTAHG